MATIKHPDTYTCDICGAEFDRKSRHSVVVRNHDEYGWAHINPAPIYETLEIDLCQKCLKSVAVVHRDMIYGDGKSNYGPMYIEHDDVV